VSKQPSDTAKFSATDFEVNDRDDEYDDDEREIDRIYSLRASKI